RDGLGRAARPRGRARRAGERRDGGACRAVRRTRMTSATHDVQRTTAPAAAARVLMIAGEASGDLHGADLLRALRARVPELAVFGIGGAGLRAAGMQTIVDAGEVATVGVVEAASHVRQLFGVYRLL